jgi:prepilin-type N-terminal cleavage/methylation domain-containing protein
MKTKNRGGFTLVEVMLALLVFSIVSLAIISGVVLMSRQSQHVRDRAFAAEKVMQMLEELRGVVSASGSGIQALANLDLYDDGTTYNYVLTTRQEVKDPGDVTSGNAARKYKRLVNVLHTNDALSRMVYVKVCDASGAVLAEAASLMRTAVSDYFPAQVYDVYLLELENVPGWWTTLTTLRPTLDNVIQDIQNRNPGLQLRIHYVTRLAYGRDPFYTPFVNGATLASAAAFPYVYFYPGLVGPDNTGNNINYYEPNTIFGRINLDNTSYPNGAPTTPTPALPNGYSMADQFNHAVRYPDEVALYAASTAAAAGSGVATPEISWRMLIEQMNTSSTTMRNLLVVNAHGEMLPLPPMRNYSDPAKDPANNPYARAVAHTENLHYASGSAVNLRVYAYSASTGAVSASAMISTITVLLPNVHLAATGTVPLTPSADIDISSTIRGSGGTSFCTGAAGNECRWTVPTVCGAGAPCAAATNTLGQYTITNPTANSTLITLYGNPLSHPNTGTTHSGLSKNSYPYGIEYVPSPPGATGFAAGQNDLTSLGTGPKNTASWVITFKAGKLPDGMITFETRIGTDTTTGCPNAIPITGTSWCSNDPPNLSRTYTWIGSGANNQPPATEQYQFLGDPVHEPYYDVKTSSGYNWYFGATGPANNNNGHGGYAGYNELAAGWASQQGGYIDADIPRFYQVLRQGLLNSNGLWTTMNGWSYYYYGLGGEFGYDGANNFNNGLEIQQRPWSTTSGAACAASCGGNCTVNEITNTWASACYSYTYERLIASTDRTWISLPWIGELYPDSQYAANWSQFGNLPTAGASADSQHFFRDQPSSTYGYSVNHTTFTFGVPTAVKMPANNGCSSFLNAEAGAAGSGTWFMHDAGTFNNNPITPLGVTQTSALNYPVPTSLTATRPFHLDDSATGPAPEWSNVVYKGQRGVSTFLNTVASPLGVTYQSTDGGSPAADEFTSGYVKVTTPTAGSPNAAYFVISGLATQTGFGTAELGEFALTSMIYEYLQAGDPTNNPTSRVTQLPLTTILSPATTAQLTNPASINVIWTSTWTRWDGQAYAATYAAGFSESITSTYNLKYSKDNGKTWYFLQDNSAATAGVLDNSAAHAIPNTTTSYSWNVSNTANFPLGDYVLMVEQYRDNFPQHYAYHSRALHITR